MPFDLVYSSDFAAGYGANNQISVQTDFVDRGFTFAVHHFYDAVNEKIYLGNGRTHFAKNSVVGLNERYVVGGSGEEVFVFSNSGRHLRTLNALLGTTRFTFYYVAGHLSVVQDHYGNNFQMGRDNQGRLQSVSSPFGQVNNLMRDPEGRISELIDPLGHRVQFQYGADDLVTKIVHKDSATAEYSYNENGELTAENHVGGKSWQITSSLSGTVKSVSFKTGMGRTTIQNFSNDGTTYARHMSLPTGEQSSYEEDQDGSTEFNSVFRSERTSTVYDPRFGSLLRRPSTSELTYGSTTAVTNHVRQVQPSPTSNTDFFSYSTLTTNSSRGGESVISTWDRIQREITTNSSVSGIRKQSLNENEEMTAYQVGNDVPMTLSRDAHGRVTQIQGADGLLQNLSFNNQGFVESITNSLNQVTQFLYNANGNATSVLSADGTMTNYEYDPKGRVTSFEVAGKLKHLFSYDVMGSLKSYRAPLSLGVFDTTHIVYDADGQLNSVHLPTGSQVSYTYFNSGLPWKMSGGSQSITTTYMMNSDLVLSLENTFNGEGVKSVFSYYGEMIRSEELRDVNTDFRYAKLEWEYDNLHRISVRRIFGNDPNISTQIAYVRNAGGRVTQVGDLELTTDHGSGRITGSKIDNVQDESIFDSYGRVSGYSAHLSSAGSAPPTLLYSYILGRDSIGRIVTLTENILGETAVYAYAYDDNGRLVEVKKDGITVNSRVFDTNGNRAFGSNWGTTFTASYDSRDRITALGSILYTYNPLGDRVSMSPLVGGSSIYEYDVTSSLRTAQTGGVTKTYQDDGFARLTVTKMNGSFQRGYLYQSEGRIAAEYNGNGHITKTYVHAFGTNAPAYMITEGQKFRILTDHLGSPRLVVNTLNGAVAQRIDYIAGGRIVRDTNSCFQPYGFAGGIWDPETGFTRFGVRNYDAKTETWTTMDPILLAGGDTNFYGYVEGDPVNWVDESGLSRKSPELGGASDSIRTTGGVGGGVLDIRPDIKVAGGRSGGNVKNFQGPPNSVVQGSGGRIYITDGSGRIVLDITGGRVKPVTPSGGFGPKRPPTREELDLLKCMKGD
ncbi:MAG: hypothetical protein KF767_04665 [Bdellovibrionaceae bacterium]|nr:hypothetical protein [Pseudobdellovibrionaceae bacterium]